MAKGTGFGIMTDHALFSDTTGMRRVGNTGTFSDNGILVMAFPAGKFCFGFRIRNHTVMTINTLDCSPIFAKMMFMHKHDIASRTFHEDNPWIAGHFGF